MFLLKSIPKIDKFIKNKTFDGFSKELITKISKEVIDNLRKNILDENGIEYIFNQPLGDFRPDFQIKDTNLIIEVQGDYWHCNPKIYSTGPKDLIQMQHVLKDYVKNCFYVSNNYNVLYIWESDINQKPQEIKNEILNIILPSPKVI